MMNVYFDSFDEIPCKGPETMKVIVEIEFIVDVPDTDELDDDVMAKAFDRIAMKPFHRLYPKMSVISYRKVEPWEQMDKPSRT